MGEVAESEHEDLGAALMAPPTAAAEIDLAADTPIELRFPYDLDGREDPTADPPAVMTQITSKSGVFVRC